MLQNSPEIQMHKHEITRHCNCVLGPSPTDTHTSTLSETGIALSDITQESTRSARAHTVWAGYSK